MILFFGIPSEWPLALAIERAERQNVPHAVLNQREIDFWDLSLTLGRTGPTGLLWLNEREWPLSGFTGVYARPIDPMTLPENCSRRSAPRDPHARSRTAFVSELLNDWLDIAPGRIVNRPSAMLSNASKPFQAQMIVGAGFLTPPTLITNDPQRVRDFHGEHGRIIYKSCSSVRSIVQEWNPTIPTSSGSVSCRHNFRRSFLASMSGSTSSAAPSFPPRSHPRRPTTVARQARFRHRDAEHATACRYRRKMPPADRSAGLHFPVSTSSVRLKANGIVSKSIRAQVTAISRSRPARRSRTRWSAISRGE